jgi:mannose-1-phosphate guanylyltransferase/mannose-6-phosphate isomerase
VAENYKQVALFFLTGLKNRQVFRAWGWYYFLIKTRFLVVKVLKFDPGGALSLQRHFSRTELWFCLYCWKGTMFYMDSFQKMKRFSRVKIKPKVWHRFINQAPLPAYFIEIQYGFRVDEDDISRL